MVPLSRRSVVARVQQSATPNEREKHREKTRVLTRVLDLSRVSRTRGHAQLITGHYGRREKVRLRIIQESISSSRSTVALFLYTTRITVKHSFKKKNNYTSVASVAASDVSCL